MIKRLHCHLCTRSLICLPVTIRGSVIAVLQVKAMKRNILLSQVLNKKMGEVEFTQDDLDIFQVIFFQRPIKGN